MFHIREITPRGGYPAVIGSDVVMETYNIYWIRESILVSHPGFEHLTSTLLGLFSSILVGICDRQQRRQEFRALCATLPAVLA